MSEQGLAAGIAAFARRYYETRDAIPLHAPVFEGNERAFVMDTLDTTMVSSVGAYVTRAEDEIARLTGSPAAVAVSNGTVALEIALKMAGVQRSDLVITQPLTFVATCNAISHCGAEPVFVDVDRRTLGLSPESLEQWLNDDAFVDDDGVCRRKSDRRRISACLPMHCFGHMLDIREVVRICDRWRVAVVEDAAEALGSRRDGQHAGTFGRIGTLSFNGNKIVTCGGGGMILADAETAARAKYLTTTAKRPHAYEYFHDAVGYNYRLPNLNAALLCAQLECLDRFLEEKRALAAAYEAYFEANFADEGVEFCKTPPGTISNCWLNAIICRDWDQKEAVLRETNAEGVGTRPIWALMTELPMYSDCTKSDLSASEFLRARVINLPSSVKSKK